MTCDEIEGMLADYLGQELGAADRRRVDGHLTGCARCRNEVDSLRGPLQELASLPEIDLAEAARRTSGLEDRRRGHRARTIVLATAAALLLGLFLGRLLAPAPPAQSTVQEPPPPKAAGLHPGWVKAASRAIAGGAPSALPPW